jgi:hypothetical protein
MKRLDPKQRALKELLEKFAGGNLSITQETADELAAKGTPTGNLPITRIEDDNNVVLGCAFWHQHAFHDDRRALCERCGADICYRPHAAKAKHKVCMKCLPDLVAELEAQEAAEAQAAAESQTGEPKPSSDSDPAAS